MLKYSLCFEKFLDIWFQFHQRIFIVYKKYIILKTHNNKNYSIKSYLENAMSFLSHVGYSYLFSSFAFLVGFTSSMYNFHCIQKKHDVHSRRAMTDTFNGRQLSLISVAASQVGFPTPRRVPIGPSQHIGALHYIVLQRRATSTSPEASRWCLCSSYNEFSKFCRGW